MVVMGRVDIEDGGREDEEEGNGIFKGEEVGARYMDPLLLHANKLVKLCNCLQRSWI